MLQLLSLLSHRTGRLGLLTGLMVGFVISIIGSIVQEVGNHEAVLLEKKPVECDVSGQPSSSPQ